MIENSKKYRVPFRKTFIEKNLKNLFIEIPYQAYRKQKEVLVYPFKNWEENLKGLNHICIIRLKN